MNQGSIHTSPRTGTSAVGRRTPFLLIVAMTALVSAQEPFRSSWGRDGLIIGAGVGTAFAASALDDTLRPFSRETAAGLDRSAVNWFDRSATYNYSEASATASDWLVGITIAAPLVLLTDAEVRKGWGTFTLMYLETMTYAAFVPSFAKGPVTRYRPLIYNPDVPFEVKERSDPARSFFSGHTTFAFASSVFLAAVYERHHRGSRSVPYVWTAALLSAGGVGYLRYDAGAHYPTDILVGAVAGTAIGLAIPYLHRNDEKTVADPSGGPVPVPPILTISYPL